MGMQDHVLRHIPKSCVKVRNPTVLGMWMKRTRQVITITHGFAIGLLYKKWKTL